MQLMEPVAAPPITSRAATARRVRPPVSPQRSWRLDPRRFGRSAAGRPMHSPQPPKLPRAAPSVRYELKLFAMTFLAGFLFVSILLG